MKKRLYVAFLFVFGLLISCHKNVSSDIFSKIEACMEMHPDSALMLLHEIPHPERLSGKQRADYALLLTQARDKNFLDSLQSDSLMKIAVDYYRDSKDDVKAGKSFFYYGKVLTLQDDDTLAMRAYLDAQSRLECTKEYKTLGLIQEYIGFINNVRGLHNAALNNYRQSISFYLKVKDTLGIVYNYRNIAWIFKEQQYNDSSSIYLGAGIALLKGDTTSLALPSLLQLQGILAGEKGDLSNAISKLLAAIRYEKSQNSIFQYYFALGDVYIQMKVFDKAEECFKQGLSSSDLYTQAGAYNFLYLLERNKANYAKAITYMEKSDSLYNMYQEEKSKTGIVMIQKRYEKEKLLIDTELAKQKKQNQIYLWMILFILLVVFCIISYPRLKRQFRRTYKKHIGEYTEKMQKVIEKNQLVIEQSFSEIEELKQQDLQMKESTKLQIGKLNQRILVLQNENKEIREEKGGFLVLEELATNKLIVSEMSSKEISSLFKHADLILNNFVTRLRQEYNLNEETLIFAVCVRLNFSVEQLSFIFDCEPASVYKRKSRLKASLHLGKTDDLDAFLKSDSSFLSS